MRIRSLRSSGPALAAALLLALVCRTAGAGTELGVRAGTSDLKGSLFRGSDAAGGVPLFGVQAGFPLIPELSLWLSGEAKSDHVRFAAPVSQSESYFGKTTWRDVSLAAALHLHLLPSVAGLFSLYAGGGGGIHFVDLKVQQITSSNPLTGKSAAPGRRAVAASDPLGDYVRKLQKERSEFSWHAVVGVSRGLPLIPVNLFLEGRFEDIQGDFSPHGYSAYVGLNLDLD
jgi:hypothetical protein